MKKILGEILFDVKMNRIIFAILTIQLTLCFFVCIFSEQLKNEIENEKTNVIVNNAENKFYDITDNLVGEYEKDFFKKANSMVKLKMMYNALAHNDKFTYLEIDNNPVVLIGENIKDELLYRYENGDAENYRGVEEGRTLNEVKCCMISSNVGNTFHFKFQKGMLWKEDEKNNVIVPVVLGSEYTGIYQVGDIIDAISFVDRNTQLQVYGILEKGAYLIHNGRMVNLDRYVLLPLKDVETVPKDAEEDARQKMLYLSKINGVLVSDLHADELQSIVQEICEKTGVLPSSSITGAANAQSYMINESMLSVLEMLENMLILLTIFAVLTTLFYMLIKIDKNKRYYAILSINGFSMKQIEGILLGNIILPVIVADFISIILSLLITFMLGFYNLPMLSLAGLNAGLILVVFFASFIKLRHLDIGACIGGGKWLL